MTRVTGFTGEVVLVLYWVVKAVLTPILRIFFRPWVVGAKNIPTAGSAILASNHLSFLDSFFLPLLVPRRITFLAKGEYFTEKGLKGFGKKVFFSGVGQVPVDRSGGAASNAALETGKKVLAGGRLLGIYPEGTRSPDAKLYRGKTGMARMAIEAQVPIIPVAMIGTYEIQPPGAPVPRVKRVGVKIGTPIDTTRYAGQAEDRRVLRSLTDEVMYELMLMGGQEYTDVYATQAKLDLEASKRAGDESMVSVDGPRRRRSAV